MPKITPFLMFNKGVKEAFEFYHSVFKNSKILTMNDMGGMASGEIEIEGQKLIGFDGGDHFSFTEGFSLMIDCHDQEEVDYYWGALSGNGGEESQCGWVKDRFGLSWQIVPKQLMELMGNPDPKKSQATLQAMLKMQKIIIADLQTAHDNA
ncbi:MAG: VOC family protein [bacterium]|nr:VOC family protein [bacterium]